MELTPRQFAERTGKNLEAIYKALQDGRLSESVRKSGRRSFIDFERGKIELFGKVQEAPSAPGGSLREAKSLADVSIPPIDESLAAEKYWKAEQAKLNYLRAAGELVEASRVQEAYEKEAAACRSKLLSVVGRVRQRVTSLSEKDFTMIEDLIKEALEELGSEVL